MALRVTCGPTYRDSYDRLPCQGRISPAEAELLIAVRVVATSLIGCHGQGCSRMSRSGGW